MQPLFFYGTLCHRPLLDLVLGDTSHLTITAATLPDHAVHWVKDQSFPVIVPASGQSADGLLVSGLSAENIARLDFYEGGYDYYLRPVELRVGDTVQSAQVYFTAEGRWPIGTPWDLAEWKNDWAAAILIAATEMMQDFGKQKASDVARRYPQILQRAMSRLRAANDPVRDDVRIGPGRSAVTIEESRQPYSDYFAIAEADLRFRRFDGSQSDRVTRAAFQSGDAVTVLPYDPVRDRVMVIEQFRFGPFVRGDARPWSLEPAAGRIDPGESPEDAAMRELQEETGITAERLLPVARYYPSPGAVAEYLYSYIAIADLPGSATGVAGLEEEAEDIRSHILPFDKLIEMVGQGQAENGPLILSALWLATRRDGLRRDA